MSTDGQGTKWRRNIAENFNRLSRVHQRYRQTDRRQTTDGRTMTYSEHELEFTFAKNECGADADCQLSEVFTDADLWPVTMTDAARIEIVTRETVVIQNKSGPFATTVRASDKAKGCTRSLTTDWFYRRLDNGEKVLRSWILACSLMSLLFLRETYAIDSLVCKT